MHPRGFRYLIFISLTKQILVLALISSRTAMGFVGIRSGSYVLGRSRERGHHAAAGQQHFAGDLCLSLSLLVDPSSWVTGGGSVTLNWRGAGNAHSLGVNSPVLGDHLTSSDRKPEGSIKLQISRGRWGCWHSEFFESFSSIVCASSRVY